MSDRIYPKDFLIKEYEKYKTNLLTEVNHPKIKKTKKIVKILGFLKKKYLYL